MNRVLTLVPLGGMCNRINSIMSGIEWTKHNPGTELRILWWKSHDLYAKFNDLFMPLDSVNVEEMKSLIKDRPAVKRNLYLPRLFRSFFYDVEITDSNDRTLFDNTVENQARIYVAACNSFCQYVIRKSIGATFRPAPELQSRIKKYTEGWNGEVVGVHVRRTDHAQAIQHSPLDNYYEKIDKELEINPKARFYLASDSEDVKNQMRTKYGDKILTQSFTLERYSVQGMKDALVELYTLASCNKILGSDYSSYSLMAARMYDIPFVCCDSK